MTVVRSVSDVLSDHVRFEIACIDRMYLTAPPQRAMRRVAANGTVTVAGQRLRVRRSYEGRTVAITIEDTVFRVLLNGAELSTHARKPDSDITLFKAYPAAETPDDPGRRTPTESVKDVMEQNRQTSPETAHGQQYRMTRSRTREILSK